MPALVHKSRLRVMINTSPFQWALICFMVLAPWVAAGQSEPAQSPLEGSIYNPAFSPSNPSLLAYERQVEDTRELYLYNYSGEDPPQRITAVDGVAEEGEKEALSTLFGTETEKDVKRFEGQLAWRPVLDAKGRQWFVFSSSAASSGAGLYLSYITVSGRLADTTISLPFEGQATLPEWSPKGRQLVFTGVQPGTTGGEIFLYPNVTRFMRMDGGVDITSFMQTDERVSDTTPVQLTENSSGNLHPTWSPNGKHIAYQAQREENGMVNWGINLLDLSSWTPAEGGMPRTVRLSHMLSEYNEYKPSWSPNGQRLAFYVPQTRVGQGGTARKQDIAILSLTTGPKGLVQQGNLRSGISGKRLVRNVLPNEVRGPEWYPSLRSDSRLLLYIKKAPDAGNPIRIADVSRWETQKQNYDRSLSDRFEKTTRLHKEVSATLLPENKLGLAFSSQVGKTDRLQVQTVSGLGTQQGCCIVQREVSRREALWRSAAFPGWGQLHKGQRRKALIFGAAGAATLLAAGVTHVIHQGKVSDYNSFVGKWGYNGDRGYTDENAATFFKGGKGLDRFRKFRKKYEGSSSAPIRNIAIAAFAGVWAWNLYDSFRGFPKLVEKPILANEHFRVERPRLGFAPVVGSRVSLSLRIRF